MTISLILLNYRFQEPDFCVGEVLQIANLEFQDWKAPFDMIFREESGSFLVISKKELVSAAFEVIAYCIFGFIFSLVICILVYTCFSL